MGSKRRPQRVLSSFSAYKLFRNELKDDPFTQEIGLVLTLDGMSRPLGVHRTAVGTIDVLQFHPRDIARVALVDGADSLVLAHTHPGGGTNPSSKDLDSLWRLIHVLTALRLHVRDELIIADNSWQSIKTFLGGPPKRSLLEGLKYHFIAQASEVDRD